jgi:RNA polymerase sigma-70 factor (ECF subfamily)
MTTTGDAHEQAGGRTRPPTVDALLERHLPGLRAFIRLRAGPVVRRCESESDLAQSVCRELLEHADRFRHGDEAGFRRWLYTTALRKIVDRHDHLVAAKRDVRRVAGDAELVETYRTFSTPSEHLSRREEVARVERAFDALTDEQREVVTLAHLVGLSRAEIADQLGKSEGAVRTMLSRTLAQLAELLEEE